MSFSHFGHAGVFRQSGGRLAGRFWLEVGDLETRRLPKNGLLVFLEIGVTRSTSTLTLSLTATLPALLDLI